VFRPPSDPTGAKRYLFTSFTLMGAILCIAGVGYVVDGETPLGLAGIVAGAIVITAAELAVRRVRS
jgi:hypothetical protein